MHLDTMPDGGTADALSPDDAGDVPKAQTSDAGAGSSCTADSALPRQAGTGAARTRPRILFVTRKWAPAVGGMETYSHELTAELSKISDLEVLALPGKEDGSVPGAKALLGFGTRSLFRTILHSRNYDAVHIGDMALWPLALTAWSRSRDTAIAASAHGTDVAYKLRRGAKPRLYDHYLRAGALACPWLRVIANSTATAELCRNTGFRNVSVLNPGVRAAAVTAGADEQPQPFVLFVGRLAERKGCGWFIREVLQKLPAGIRLIVAGTPWDQSEVDALRHPRVEFLGPVFGDRLQALRRQALAVVMPNVPCGGRDFEGFGLTAVEAAAEGAVLLASGIDGITDAVVDGVTGFLLPPEHAQVWIGKLQEVAAWSPEQRGAFLRRARETATNRYSWQRMAHSLLAEYQRPLVPAHCGLATALHKQRDVALSSSRTMASDVPHEVQKAAAE